MGSIAFAVTSGRRLDRVFVTPALLGTDDEDLPPLVSAALNAYLDALATSRPLQVTLLRVSNYDVSRATLCSLAGFLTPLPRFRQVAQAFDRPGTPTMTRGLGQGSDAILWCASVNWGARFGAATFLIALSSRVLLHDATA